MGAGAVLVACCGIRWYRQHGKQQRHVEGKSCETQELHRWEFFGSVLYESRLKDPDLDFVVTSHSLESTAGWMSMALAWTGDLQRFTLPVMVFCVFALRIVVFPQLWTTYIPIITPVYGQARH